MQVFFRLMALTTLTALMTRTALTMREVFLSTLYVRLVPRVLNTALTTPTTSLIPLSAITALTA